MNNLKKLPIMSVFVSDTEINDIGRPFANATIKLRCVQKNFALTNVTKLKFRGWQISAIQTFLLKKFKKILLR